MPGGGRTGPIGLGPMTGRAAGYCAGFGALSLNPSYGLGFWGWGRGHGRGRRHRLYAAGFTGWPPAFMGWPAIAGAWRVGPFSSTFSPGVTRQQEIDALKGQAEYIEDVVDGLRRRIDELATKPSEV